MRKELLTKHDPAKVLRIKKLVMRDWLWLSVWYIRLKKISKGVTPYSVLQIEEAVKAKDFANPVAKVKKARL